MKRLLAIGLALVGVAVGGGRGGAPRQRAAGGWGVAVAGGRADAHGKRSSCGWSAAASCDVGEVAYAEQVMTGYRAEVRTRMVQRAVARVVTREVEEAYAWQETVAVSVPVKQMQT